MERTEQRRAWYLRTTWSERLFKLFSAAVLTLLCLTIVYPFWTQVLLSFSDVDEATSLGLRLWIKEWHTGAYLFAFSGYGNVLVAYGNSIFRVVVGTALCVTFTILAAYPLSKRRLPGRTLLTVLVLITMFFSGGIIPQYLLMRYLGLIDTRWSLILPTLTTGFYVIITRNFMMTMDEALEEAAFMEGAHYGSILIRIIVPLSKPVIATVLLWAAVYHWNEWFHALIYINEESKVVLQLLLRRMLRDLQQAMSDSLLDFALARAVKLPTAAVQAAVVILTVGPIVLLYPFVQRHFVRGIFVGSLKG